MKSKIHLLTGFCLAALALGGVSHASAKAKPSATPAATVAASPTTETTKAPRAIPFRGKVSAVDASAKTFSIAGKANTRVFRITAATVILKQDAPATMADIVAEEEVRGSYWKKEDGSLEAKKVNLGPKTEAEKAAKTSKKDKATPQ